MIKEIIDLDLIIIGGGPAGLTAAIYGARAKLKLILLEDQLIGGQIRSSYIIDNYPGFESIEGNALADLIQSQAKKLGAKIDSYDNIVKVDFSDDKKLIETEKYIYNSKAVIISTGATPKKLPIPNEQNYSGKGVHYCAVCDGAVYEGSTIGVVGGGNSALEEALFLTKFADKVYMIRRFDYFKGEKATIEELLKNPKIEVLYNWDLEDVNGNVFVENAVIKNTLTGEIKDISLEAVFGYIGSEPKTQLYTGQIALNNQGFILTDENMRTNVKGVFAAGDVRDKHYRQITTAVSDGTIAALEAEKYITEHNKNSLK